MPWAFRRRRRPVGERLHARDHAVGLEVAADRGRCCRRRGPRRAPVRCRRRCSPAGPGEQVLDLVDALADGEHRRRTATAARTTRTTRQLASTRRRRGRPRRRWSCSPWGSGSSKNEGPCVVVVDVLEGPVLVLVGHGSPCSVVPAADTASPGTRPVARSASSAFCRMTTAAAWSTTARRDFPLRPRSRSTASAETVLSRSSKSRTPTPVGREHRGQRAGERRGPWRPPAPRRRTRSGAGRRPPRPPSCSSTSAASRSRSPRPRATVSTGRGDEPVGVATGDADAHVAHVDAEPTLAPRLTRPGARSTSARTSASAWSACAASAPPPCATSSLPPPLPPSAAVGDLDQRVRRQAPRARLVVDRDDHRRLAVDGRRRPPPRRAVRPAAGRARRGRACARPRRRHRRRGARRSRPRRRPRAARASSPAAASSWATRTRSISFSAPRSRSTRSATRSGSSSGRALSASLSWATSTCSRARKRYASAPTSASTRRTPEPIDDSPSSLTTPSCADRPVCVPPQSSRAQSPTRDDPHLVAVLLAEERHRAGADRLLLAHDLGVHRQVREHQVVDPRLDVVRAPRSAPRRSPRSRTGSDRARSPSPAWVAVSPSASRNALCTMCVAVCARLIDRRRSTSTSACACSPERHLTVRAPAPGGRSAR